MHAVKCAAVEAKYPSLPYSRVLIFLHMQGYVGLRKMQLDIFSCARSITKWPPKLQIGRAFLEIPASSIFTLVPVAALKPRKL